MAPKRCATDKVGSEHKKKRTSVTMAVKLDVIKRSEKGERAVDIGRYLSLPPTTVRSIVKLI